MQRSQRLQRLRAALRGEGLDAVLLRGSGNLRYLCGTPVPGGALFVPAQEPVPGAAPAWLLADPSTEAHPEPDPTVRWLTRSGPWPQHEAELLELSGIRRLGFEEEHWSVRDHGALKAATTAHLLDVSNMLAELRSIKEPSEIEALRAAAALTDRLMDAAKEQLRPGLSELELSAWLGSEVLLRGAEELAFPVMVAFGPNTARLHPRPGDRRLQDGDLVLVDLGVRKAGYCSDLTRVWSWGSPSKLAGEIHRIIFETLGAVLERARPGTPLEELQRVADRNIQEAGYGEYFRHCLGHGIGVEVHEAPSVCRGNRLALETGMVLSLEPGICIPGYCGVRIERMVHISAEGPELLSEPDRAGWSSELGAL